MSEGIRPGVWDKLTRKTPQAALERKQESEPFTKFAARFHEQAELALNNRMLVASIEARMREIDIAFAAAMSGQNQSTLENICLDIARQNPKAFPDTLDDTNNSKERAAYVLALANQLITQPATIH